MVQQDCCRCSIRHQRGHGWFANSCMPHRGSLLVCVHHRYEGCTVIGILPNLNCGAGSITVLDRGEDRTQRSPPRELHMKLRLLA